MAYDLEAIAGQANTWLDQPVTFADTASAPQQTWLQRITQPWSNAAQGMWGGVTSTAAKVSEKLPDVLFGWVGEKLGLVQKPQDQGAGTTIIYQQPPVAGGTPAQSQPIPGQPMYIPISTPQAAGISSTAILVIVGVGLLILFATRGR